LGKKNETKGNCLVYRRHVTFIRFFKPFHEKQEYATGRLHLLYGRVKKTQKSRPERQPKFCITQIIFEIKIAFFEPGVSQLTLWRITKPGQTQGATGKLKYSALG
jgi:hypothetical protein